MYEIVDVIWPFLMVAAFGRLHVYREKRWFFRTLLLGIPLILYGVLGGAMDVLPILGQPDLKWQTPLMMLWAAVTMFFVGFREESVYRGIIVNVLADKYLKDRRGILITTLIAAALFGVMHMQNMAIGQSFAESVIQSVNAFFLGTLIVAVYLRGGNLWALMLLHGFIDLAVSISVLLTVTYSQDLMASLATEQETSVSPVDLLIYAVFWGIYLGVALLLLRKKKCGEIVERFQAKAEIE